MKSRIIGFVLALSLGMSFVWNPSCVKGEEGIPVTMVGLNYTRDVFVSTGESYGNSPEKYVTLTNNVGLLEDKLTNLSGYSNGILNYDGAAYKFGPLGAVGSPNNAPNAIHAADKNPIVIDLKDGLYSSIRFIANNNSSSQANATVTVSYSGQSTPGSTGITRIASFRNQPSPLLECEKYLGKIGATRTGGFYDGFLYAYYIVPDAGKIVDKITIECSNAVVLAVTAIGVSKADLCAAIRTNIASLPEANAVTQQYRSAVRTILDLIDTAKTQGVTAEEINNIEGMDKLREIDKKLIRLTGNNIKVDMDNIDVGINFSGPIAQGTVNKSNISILKGNGTVIDNDYHVALTDGAIGKNVIKITIKNELDYTSKYTVRLSQNIAGSMNPSLTLGSDAAVEFVPDAPFEVKDFILKDASGNVMSSVTQASGKNVTASVSINNKTLTESRSYVATVALFSPEGRMAEKKIITGNVATGQTANHITEPFSIPGGITQGWTIECYVWDSYSGMKQLYNTLIK